MLPRGGCHQTDLFIRRHLSAIMGGDAIPLRPCRTSSKNIGAFRRGPDDLRQAGHSELGPQPADVDREAVGFAAEVELPDLTEQGLGRDRLARRFGQPPKQRELTRVEPQPALSDMAFAGEQSSRSWPCPRCRGNAASAWATR